MVTKKFNYRGPLYRNIEGRVVHKVSTISLCYKCMYMLVVPLCQLSTITIIIKYCNSVLCTNKEAQCLLVREAIWPSIGRAP